MKAVEVTKFSPQTSFHDSNLLIADGGVIGRNPSKLGGTFACKLIMGGKTIFEHSGLLTPEDEMPLVTNNLSELWAVVEGLKMLPPDWRGTIWSDSKITLLRVFCGGETNNVPWWMINRLVNHKARLIHWNQIQYGLLDGHPTKQHLAQGYGKRGYPVHQGNVWADAECTRLSKEFQEKLAHQSRLEQQYSRAK